LATTVYIVAAQSLQHVCIYSKTVSQPLYWLVFCHGKHWHCSELIARFHFVLAIARDGTSKWKAKCL